MSRRLRLSRSVKGLRAGLIYLSCSSRWARCCSKQIRRKRQNRRWKMRSVSGLMIHAWCGHWSNWLTPKRTDDGLHQPRQRAIFAEVRIAELLDLVSKAVCQREQQAVVRHMAILE